MLSHACLALHVVTQHQDQTKDMNSSTGLKFPSRTVAANCAPDPTAVSQVPPDSGMKQKVAAGMVVLEASSAAVLKFYNTEERLCPELVHSGTQRQ